LTSTHPAGEVSVPVAPNSAATAELPWVSLFSSVECLKEGYSTMITSI